MIKIRKSELDKRIEELTQELIVTEPGSKEYQAICKDILTLKAARAKDRRIDPNVVLGILGTFGVGVAFMIFEETHVLNGKCWSLITRLLPR